MINVEKRASAHLPLADSWLGRGEALGRGAGRAARAVGGWLNRVISGIAEAQARRATRRELYALDDRILADIGLQRDQVADCVDAMFRSNAEAPKASAPAAVTSEDITEVNASNDGQFKSAA